MRLKKNSFIPGQFYHMYNHAVSGRLLFCDEQDYLMCINLIKQYYHPDDFSIVAYCLMPNHYHILGYQKTEYDFTRLFSSIWRRFSTYYNTRHGMRGTVFAGKMQHLGIREETYLLRLCAYIHLNPLKAGLVSDPEVWHWSNLPEWLSLRNGQLIDREVLRMYHISAQNYREALSTLIPDATDMKHILDERKE